MAEKHSTNSASKVDAVMTDCFALFHEITPPAKRHKLESRLPGEISITPDMQMTPPLWQKVKRS